MVIRLRGPKEPVSPGSLTIHWPDRKVLFTGDTLLSDGIGRTDFMEGNPNSLKKSIERMSRLEIDLLLPGHGEIVSGREKVLENFEFVCTNFFPYL